ncbi:MAG: hypothetical protein ACOC0M_00605 [Halomonas sp.]
MTPEQIATIGQHLARLDLSRRASRAAWAILGRRATGLVTRNKDIAEATGWTPHNASKAIRDLEDQAPGLLAPRSGYKAPLAFAIEGDQPVQAAGEIGASTGPKMEMGPVSAPKIGTSTGPKSEIGASTDPKNSATLTCLVKRGSERDYRVREDAPETPQEAPADLPNLTQAQATQDPSVITVGATRDRLATLGFKLPALTSPATVQMIQRWRAWGTTEQQLATAIAAAHEQNGGRRPTSPAYYEWAVANVIKADQEAAREPEHGSAPLPETKATKPGKTTKGAVSHEHLSDKDYTAGATQPADLPAFLRQ